MSMERPASLRKSFAELAEKYRLTAIYAFGSRAKEIWQRLNGLPAQVEFPASDLDIGVLPQKNTQLALNEKIKLALRLEELFDVPQVDLIVLPEAPPFLALDIVRGELLHVTDEDAEAEYQLYVLRRAGDLAPWQHEKWQMFVEAEAHP